MNEMSDEDTISKLWDKYDSDNNGILSLDEVEKFLEDLAMEFKDESLIAQKDLLFNFLDSNKDGSIQKDELLNLLK